jgi:hypothetical protein
MTKYRALYVNCDTALPSHANHPVGTAKFWGVTLLPPSEPPAHTVTEPVGTRKGDGTGGGGYAAPFTELRLILLVVITSDVTALDADRLFVNISEASKRGTLIVLSACIVDVVIKFILAVRELNWKHPMLLAVVV